MPYRKDASHLPSFNFVRSWPRRPAKSCAPVLPWLLIFLSALVLGPLNIHDFKAKGQRLCYVLTPSLPHSTIASLA